LSTEKHGHPTQEKREAELRRQLQALEVSQGKEASIAQARLLTAQEKGRAALEEVGGYSCAASLSLSLFLSLSLCVWCGGVRVEMVWRACACACACACVGG
jgi:hypothetical protein